MTIQTCSPLSLRRYHFPALVVTGGGAVEGLRPIAPPCLFSRSKRSRIFSLPFTSPIPPAVSVSFAQCSCRSRARFLISACSNLAGVGGRDVIRSFFLFFGKGSTECSRGVSHRHLLFQSKHSLLVEVVLGNGTEFVRLSKQSMKKMSTHHKVNPHPPGAGLLRKMSLRGRKDGREGRIGGRKKGREGTYNGGYHDFHRVFF